MNSQQATVIISGRLVDDPKVKQQKKAAVTVTEISVAVNGPGPEEVIFIDAAIFGENYAMLLEENATKGTEIVVFGRLRQSRWKDDSGVSHSRHSVLASHLAVVPKPQQETAEKTA
ncbi:single-stranded DNA-binding protein [Bythopirellula goksoeyrii]|uniref:Single-stranded DNA-binding protein n=1 Tax=Bythopirellula goksoeyrii TaxID=1400387 RepID=A0A5B9Q9W6_9BACT|nr:single-stranded DNA-binding protein [Bythopirellula goksoeyrii]QEG35844.1 Single-stranded DNA-binding protein [Bythopirellula goksoeyrii]